MMNRMTIATAVLVLSSSAAASAQDWRRLFPDSSHDFGVVARASETVHRFEFENPFPQAIHISAVRTSCGCTTPLIETPVVEPGERGSILARFNTRSHSGQRQATITVAFSQPQRTEIQLTVRGYIRTDVVFNPGQADFGSLPAGLGKQLEIQLDYVGRADWQLLGVDSPDDFIKADFEQVQRRGGQARYRVQVELLPATPAGTLQTELILRTNDRNLTRLPLPVVARVVPPVSISPPVLALGSIPANYPFEQMLILKGQAPFRVTRIASDIVEVDHQLPEAAARLHTVPLRLMAVGEPGERTGVIQVWTDQQPEQPLTIDCSLTLVVDSGK
jgi:hypothetical protein